jgi:hypothetical protein
MPYTLDDDDDDDDDDVNLLDENVSNEMIFQRLAKNCQQ